MKYFLVIIFFVFYSVGAFAQPTVKDNLLFDSFATRWDEAIPIGKYLFAAFKIYNFIHFNKILN